MFTTSPLKHWLLIVFVVTLLAAACSSDGGGDELTADTTTTPTVVETIVADDTSATAELQVESTTTVPVSDTAQEHGPDRHTDDEATQTDPTVASTPLTCLTEYLHVHPTLRDVHVDTEKPDECHAHTCETAPHGPDITYAGHPWPCPEETVELAAPTTTHEDAAPVTTTPSGPATTAPTTTVKITETTVPVTVPSTNERVTVPIREGVTIHDDGRATVADPNLDGDNNPATGDDNCYTQNNGYRVCNVYHYGNDPQLPARANQFERIANPGDFILSGPNSDGHAASLPIDLQIGSWRTVPQSPGYDFEGWQIVVEIRPLTTLGSNVYDIRLCDVSPWWGNNGHYVGTANGMTWGVYAVQDDDGRYRLAMKGARFGEPC